MYISKKHITIFTGESCFEYPPKLYVDWFLLKANLKHQWRDCASFQFRLGLFSFHLCIILEWGFIERERNEFEEGIHQSTQSLVDALSCSAYPKAPEGSKLEVESLDATAKSVTYWMPWRCTNIFERLWYYIKCGHKETEMYYFLPNSTPEKICKKCKMIMEK